MTTAIFRQFAAYNRWANARLYAAALALPDKDYRRPICVFFKSLHGTLNHLLVTDRLWLCRLTGEGDVPNRLDASSTMIGMNLHAPVHARTSALFP